MGNIFNEDFRDFLTALHRNGVRYVLVGGYSVILHGYSRTTGDLDIWVIKRPRIMSSWHSLFKNSACPYSA